MSFAIVPAHDLPLAGQADVINAGFAGYVGGWHDFDAEALARFLSSQGADLSLSRFLRTADGLLSGFGYLNRTGRILRLTGMAILPAARGSGAAGHLLTHLFDEAQARGDEAMILEVIEQNPRGHAFYRRHGFRELTRLCSWRRQPGGGAGEAGSTAEIEEIPVTRAFDWPGAVGYPEIPWQISRHAAARAANTRAFCAAAGACIVLGDPPGNPAPPLRVHALFSTSPASGYWDGLRALCAQLFVRFPDREFLASAIFPEAFGDEFFIPLGFAREPMSQFLMRRDF